MKPAAAICAVLLLCAPAPQDPPVPPPPMPPAIPEAAEAMPPIPEPPPKQEVRTRQQERIEEGVRWLLDDDPELSKLGRRRLLEVGVDAIAALEEEINKRDAAKLYEVARDILLARPGEAEWIEDQAVRDIRRKLQSEGKGLEKAGAERYVYAKFSEALAIAEKQDYQRAYAVANALVILEPDSRYQEKLKTFRRYCDQRITQQTLIKGEVFVEKTRYTVGDKIPLRLRMQNVSPAGIKLWYRRPENKNKIEGKILIPVKGVFQDVQGGDTEVHAHLETSIDAEVPIATGAQWEAVVELDTSSIFPESDFYRCFTVSAWTQPLFMEVAGGRMIKKIVFEPVTLKVVPKKYAILLQNPLQGLGKMMDSGTVNEVFCAAMLLDDDQRPMGIEMLVAALESSKTPLGRQVITLVLQRVTGQKIGAVAKEWREWLKTLKQ